MADELGSGIKKISKYTNIHFGTSPIFKEDDLFVSMIPTIVIEELNIETELYRIIGDSPGISRSQINDIVRYYLRRLTEKNKIENFGTNKKPNYKVIE